MDVTPVDDTDYRCRECGKGEYETATKCQICGTYYYDEDGIDVCEACLEDEETVENAIGIGAENTEPVDINGFFVALFGAAKINEILAREAQKAKQSDIMAYLYEDKISFVEYVKEVHHGIV
jgi:hypothetical protein